MVLLEEAAVREEELSDRLHAVRLEIQGLLDADEVNRVVKASNDELSEAAMGSIGRVHALEEDLRKESERVCHDKSHHIMLINNEIRKTVTDLKEELEILKDPTKNARQQELGIKLLDPCEMRVPHPPRPSSRVVHLGGKTRCKRRMAPSPCALLCTGPWLQEGSQPLCSCSIRSPSVYRTTASRSSCCMRRRHP